MTPSYLERQTILAPLPNYPEVSWWACQTGAQSEKGVGFDTYFQKQRHFGKSNKKTKEIPEPKTAESDTYYFWFISQGKPGNGPLTEGEFGKKTAILILQK